MNKNATKLIGIRCRSGIARVVGCFRRHLRQQGRKLYSALGLCADFADLTLHFHHMHFHQEFITTSLTSVSGSLYSTHHVYLSRCKSPEPCRSSCFDQNPESVSRITAVSARMNPSSNDKIAAISPMELACHPSFQPCFDKPNAFAPHF